MDISRVSLQRSLLVERETAGQLLERVLAALLEEFRVEVSNAKLYAGGNLQVVQGTK
ncbi:hypothetical protein [Microcoleus sp. FACHB-831]|uniref:hypothetical protein n=1 Tax=Microcoleus sp. FACHB-831 TaxID=2692827 RepID=UPI00168284F0|nr:hypothetical protein [Microcoleus sp. FACHB-831]